VLAHGHQATERHRQTQMKERIFFMR